METLSFKFEKGSVLTTILKFSLPSSLASIIGMICVLTDRLFIGQVAGRDGMSAIAIVFPYTMLINSFTFLFSGISILVGIKLGENRKNEAGIFLTTGFFWLFLIGFFLTGFLYLFNIPLLKLFGATSSNFAPALEYTKFLIPMGLFQLILGQSSTIRGMGNLFFSTFINILTAILNVILDYLFIMKWNYGIAGAGLATLIATAFSALLIIIYFLKSEILSFSRESLTFKVDILKEITKIGSPRFFNQLLQASVITITNRQAGIYGGDIATAAIGIISICRAVMNNSLQGFNLGTAAIISYNFGAKNFKRVYDSFNLQLSIVFSLSTLSVLGMFLFTDEIVSCFVKNDFELIKFTSHAMKQNLFLMPFTAVFLASNNLFQSIKENKIATYFFIIRILVLNIPLLYLLGYLFKETGVWYAFPISDTLSGIILFILAQNRLKKLKKSI